MPGCSAIGCNRTNNGGKLHKFPMDIAKRTIWAVNLGRKTEDNQLWLPKPNSFLCEAHFDKSQYEPDKNKVLRWNAVPTIFSIPDSSPIKPQSRKRRRKIKEVAIESEQGILDSSNCPENSISQGSAEMTNGEILKNELNPTKRKTLSASSLQPRRCSQRIEKTPSKKYFASSDEDNDNDDDDDFTPTDEESSTEKSKPTQTQITEKTSSEIFVVSSDDKSTLLDGGPSIQKSKPTQTQSTEKDAKKKGRRKKKRTFSSKNDPFFKDSVIGNYQKVAERHIKSLRKQVGQLNRSLRRIFTHDQLQRLASPKELVKWSKDTIRECLLLRFVIGAKGYEFLCRKGYPIPSSNILIHSKNVYKQEIEKMNEPEIVAELSKIGSIQENNESLNLHLPSSQDLDKMAESLDADPRQYCNDNVGSTDANPVQTCFESLISIEKDPLQDCDKNANLNEKDSVQHCDETVSSFNVNQVPNCYEILVSFKADPDCDASMDSIDSDPVEDCEESVVPIKAEPVENCEESVVPIKAEPVQDCVENVDSIDADPVQNSESMELCDTEPVYNHGTAALLSNTEPALDKYLTVDLSDILLSVLSG